MSEEFTFDSLTNNINLIHEATSTYAKNAVNQLLTVRNWIIGYYIVEFEQNGKDKSKYGSSLLTKLAEKLNIKGLDRSMLNICRTFYIKYPQICDSVNHKLNSISEIKHLPDFSIEGSIST